MIRKEFKSVTLIFENCNAVIIDPKYVLCFTIRGIKQNLWSNGSQYGGSKSCEYFNIMLDNKALKTNTHFENMTDNNSKCSFIYHLKNYHDITNVIVIGLDDSKEEVSVPWKEASEDSNALEKVEFRDKDFIIEIG